MGAQFLLTSLAAAWRQGLSVPLGQAALDPKPVSAEPRECEQSPRQPASFPIGVGRTHSIVLPPENSEASLALVSWCFYYLRLEEGQVQ